MKKLDKTYNINEEKRLLKEFACTYLAISAFTVGVGATIALPLDNINIDTNNENRNETAIYVSDSNTISILYFNSNNLNYNKDQDSWNLIDLNNNSYSLECSRTFIIDGLYTAEEIHDYAQLFTSNELKVNEITDKNIKIREK